MRQAFESRQLALLLLALHMGVLLAFTARRWTRVPVPRSGRDSAAFIVHTLFTCNFVGVAFARTLHYQFYCWYFHALPVLLWGATGLPHLLRVVVLVSVEVAFNVFESTWWSSALLQSAHAVALAALWWHRPSYRDDDAKQA